MRKPVFSCTISYQVGTNSYQFGPQRRDRTETEERRDREDARERNKETDMAYDDAYQNKTCGTSAPTPTAIDALEAVRRLTLERDALAEQVRALTADNQILTDTLGDTPCVPPSEICRTRHLQNCHACDRADCCDNITPSIQALLKERDALAEQVKRLRDRPTHWETVRDGRWAHHNKDFTAIVDRRDGKFYATARTVHQEMSRPCGFYYFHQAADHCMVLGRELTRNAPQAPERRATAETGTEAGEGENGAPRGFNAPSWGKIAK